ncbi:MAG TPA: transposase [Solirubrobacteraceae bacterium]|nr:transposase [Solirubrobacteraceae bacterium]
MAQNFLSCDREQDFLMPPSVREWLPAGHLAWYLLDVIGRLDLDAFYGEYRADGSGRPAHDPAMMVALLLYAYAVGERSSRQIERRCVEDVGFRVIAANRAPDHTTISRFRKRHAERLAALFVQVLAMCAKAGMVRVGTVAVDGTKLAANAGISANRSYERIRQEVERILAEADEADAAEDERFGDARGDELPAELADPVTRRERLERAKRELEAEQAARVAEHEAMLARRAEHRERTGRNPRGRPPGEGPGPQPPADAKRNITDPDSRIMRDRGAHVQAFNAQAVVGEGRVILAADVTTSPNDSNQLLPMLQAARENLQAIGHDNKIKCVLADGGYWNHDDITTARQSAVVVIPTSDPHNTHRKQAPRQGPEADRINKILAGAAGKRLYRRRAELVEPVFAHTKHTRQITRFSRRGHTAVRAEWRLIAATHNLLKLFRHQPQIA